MPGGTPLAPLDRCPRRSNIATFNLGRSAPGEDAIALIEVDTPISEAVLAKVKAVDGVVQAKKLSF